MTEEQVVLVVRPRRRLLVTATWSLVLAMIPTFGVLYIIAMGTGTWEWVLLIQFGIIVVCAAIAIRQFTVRTEVTATHIRGRGIFSPWIEVPLEDVHESLIVKTYSAESPDVVEQLLLRGADGRRVYRMRGNFYEPGAMHEVAAALPVAPLVCPEVMPIKRFFTDYPTSEYWFENKPLLHFVWVPVGLLLVLAVAALVFGLTGAENVGA